MRRASAAKNISHRNAILRGACQLYAGTNVEVLYLDRLRPNTHRIWYPIVSRSLHEPILNSVTNKKRYFATSSQRKSEEDVVPWRQSRR